MDGAERHARRAKDGLVDLGAFLHPAIQHNLFEQTEKGHGRIEWLKNRHDWTGLQSVTVMDCQRTIDGQSSTERRYFISSLPGRTAQRIAMAVRKRWRAENELHWSLDVCFNEDQSRARIAKAAENLSCVRRIALRLLRQDTSTKASLRRKRSPSRLR